VEAPAVELGKEARDALRPDEALVFDWHRVAICCAAAGEVSLCRTTMTEVSGAGSQLWRTDERDGAPGARCC
jgi:hypothetical protein